MLGKQTLVAQMVMEKRKLININLDKARDIRKAQLREERAPKLAELDIEFQIALEQGDSGKQASVVAYKQELRDITDDPRFLSATSIEDLEAITLPTR